MKYIVLALVLINSVISINQYHASTVEKIFEQFKNSKKNLFKAWHLVYNKNYKIDSLEAKLRFANFKKNLKDIEKFNKENHSHKLGVGPFSDLSDIEFKDTVLMKKVPSYKEMVAIFEKEAQDKLEKENKEKLEKEKKENSEKAQTSSQNFMEDDDDDLTKRNLIENVDFRSHFPHIKHQGTCASSYVFSTMAAIEASFYACNHNTVSLSEQHLLDCNDFKYDCRGGDSIAILQYNFNIDGTVKSSDYEYVGRKQECKKTQRFYNFLGGIKVCGYFDEACNAKTFNEMVSEGPVVVEVNADDWQNYKGGIYKDNSTGEANHSVIIVGSGKDSQTGDDYLLVRNSWGTVWGESGYMRYFYEKDKLNKISKKAWALKTSCGPN